MAGRTAAGAAPKTWFRQRGRGEETWLLDLVAAAVVFCVPLAFLLTVVVTAATWWWRRLRWWWLVAAAAALGLAVGVVFPGWVGAAEAYGLAFREIADSARRAGGFWALAGRRWVAWAVGMAPLSAPVALAASGGLLWARDVRRAAWRSGGPGRPGRRRLAKAEAAATALGTEAGGVPIGVDLDTAEPVVLAPDSWREHALLVGSTGSGKTTVIGRLSAAHLARGHGQVIIDLKADPALAVGVGEAAAACGRPFYHFTLGGPLAWNPLARGDRTSRADKLIAVEDWSETFYKR